MNNFKGLQTKEGPLNFPYILLHSIQNVLNQNALNTFNVLTIGVAVMVTHTLQHHQFNLLRHSLALTDANMLPRIIHIQLAIENVRRFHRILARARACVCVTEREWERLREKHLPIREGKHTRVAMCSVS